MAGRWIFVTEMSFPPAPPESSPGRRLWSMVVLMVLGAGVGLYGAFLAGGAVLFFAGFTGLIVTLVRTAGRRRRAAAVPPAH